MTPNFFKIDPMHEKKTFLRKAWISLAQEDVPLDAFEADFSEVATADYHVFCTGANYDMSWNGEIGNYRTESYIDIETYYDNEPYTDYEEKYDSTEKRVVRRAVTKYRKVEKQRQVRKERTVTDWHSGNGEHSGQTKSWECIDAGDTFNQHRYDADIRSDFFVALTPDELEKSADMVITDDMYSRAEALCVQHAENNLWRALPGDTTRNITYRINSFNVTYASLFRFPEYSVSINYNGRTYAKRAFACGGMTMAKAGIPNPISVEEEKKKLHGECDKKIEEEYKQVKQKAWKKVLPVYLAGVSVLTLSIVMSLFVHYLFPVIACFAVSVAAFIFAKKFAKKVKENANKILNTKVEEFTSIYKEKIKNYNDVHMQEIFKALNKKLTSLGFDPATDTEFYNVNK